MIFGEVRNKLILRVGIVVMVLTIALLGLKFEKQINAFFLRRNSNTQIPEVNSPTIINGELVLPKVSTNSKSSNIGVNSANLVPIFDASAGSASSPQASKIIGLRILGEMTNLTGTIITGFSPVLKFYDKEGKVLAQKIAEPSNNFDFFPLGPKKTSFYDFSVMNPPESDKLEIVINSTGATNSASLDFLKINGQEIEVKTAKYQNRGSSQPIRQAQGEQKVDSLNSAQGVSTQSAMEATKSGETATQSGGPSGSEGEMINQGSGGTDSIEYFTVTGSVVNSFTDPLTDITIYAWVKDAEGKVFSFGRQDFRNDLISPQDKVDFRINLLPLRTDQKYAQYEVQAWGRRYRLGI